MRFPLALVLRQMSKGKKSSGESSVDIKPSGPVSSNKNGNVVIHILAKPGAKANGVTDICEDGVGVQIASKPVDGEANAELLKFMSGVLGLKKNEISLDKGSKSRQKTLVIDKKDCSIDFVLHKLREEMKK